MMDRLKEFWKLVHDVWGDAAFGIGLDQLLIAFAILLVFLAIRGLFSRFVIRRLARWAKKTETEVDDVAIDALDDPIRFIPVVMGVFFGTSALGLEGYPAEIADGLNRSLVAIALFWIMYRLVTPLALVLQGRKDFFTEAMVDWFVKAVRIAVFLIAGATVLEIWGIKVGPILAGLGLFGVAVALGAQDLFRNLIAGIFIIGEHRFLAGDWILVDGVVEGTVEKIGFRTTTVRRFDKALVYVPNAKLSDNATTNFSRMTHRRIKWLIGLEYRTTSDQIRAIRDGINAYLIENDAFANPDEVSTFVRVDGFADSSINIFLYCFTKTTDWGEWLAVKEQLAYKIQEIVEGEGAGFAFPSQSLYIESLPGEAVELLPTAGGAEK